MEGTEAIIQKIILDAENKAEDCLKTAKTSADNKIKEAESWAEQYLKAQRELLEKEKEEMLSRKMINAKLEIKKAELKSKQEVVSESFLKAYGVLCAMPKPKYLSFVKSLIENNADIGDKIVLSKDGVLKDSDFDSEFLKVKSLSIKKEKGDFIGGVILEGKCSDKDLTFNSIVEDKKDTLIKKVAEILF